MTFLLAPFANPVLIERNRIPNPSFQVNAATWEPGFGTPTLQRSSAKGGFSGTHALRVYSASGITDDAEVPKEYIDVNDNVEYTFSVYVRAGTVARSTRVLIRFYDAGGVQLGTTVEGTAAFDDPDEWQRRTVTATSPVGSVSAAVIVRQSSSPIGESHYWDAAMLTTGDTAPDYFDGDTPRSGTTFYQWLGTPHESASVARGPGEGDSIEPLFVAGPYVNDVEARNQARSLLESSETRVVFVPSEATTGTFQLTFSSYAQANAARTWFTQESNYYYAGPTVEGTGGYAIEDGYIVETPAEYDTSFDLLFTVAGGALNVTQNTPWVLTVPWVEATE
jgi:hypothetical protein